MGFGWEGESGNTPLDPNRVAFCHHPFTLDCQLNLASDSKVKGDATDSIGQQIQDTKLLLEKAKRRYSQQFQPNRNLSF